MTTQLNTERDPQISYRSMVGFQESGKGGVYTQEMGVGREWKGRKRSLPVRYISNIVSWNLLPVHLFTPYLHPLLSNKSGHFPCDVPSEECILVSKRHGQEMAVLVHYKRRTLIPSISIKKIQTKPRLPYSIHTHTHAHTNARTNTNKNHSRQTRSDKK